MVETGGRATGVAEGLWLVASAVAALLGLVLWAQASDPGMAAHGLLFMLAAIAAGFGLIKFHFDGEAPAAGDSGYNDGVVRAGVVATMFWGLAGFVAGVFIALQLVFPALNFDLPGRPLVGFARFIPRR